MSLTLTGYWNLWLMCGIAWIWWRLRCDEDSWTAFMAILIWFLGPIGPVLYFLSWVYAKLKDYHYGR